MKAAISSLTPSSSARTEFILHPSAFILPHRRPHLTALLIIMALVAIVLGVLNVSVDRIEAAYVHELLASGEEFNSLRSLSLQRCVLRQPDLLPLYGSSELLKPVPNRAPDFFRTYPTGFSIYPIGKAGTYPLVMLQQLAGVGSELRGKKIAISLSSGWFREGEMIASHYRGNFLLSTAREFLFSSNISLDFRRAAAARMLQFPDTLARDPLTEFAARHLAGGSRRDRLAYWTAYPLGRLQIFVSRWQDHFEVVGAALNRRRQLPSTEPVQRMPVEIDWTRSLADASREAGDRPGDETDPQAMSRRPHPALDAEFLATLDRSPVWADLDLLLRALHEAGARPLVLCTPMNGPYFAKNNISRSARDAFYLRLAATVGPYQFTLRDFADHDTDRHFENDRFDHLSEKGWMYYNLSLEAFMHDRFEGSYGTFEILE